jgi:hypothetical protein
LGVSGAGKRVNAEGSKALCLSTPFWEFHLTYVFKLQENEHPEIILSTPFWEFRGYGIVITPYGNVSIPVFLLPFGSFLPHERRLLQLRMAMDTFYSLLGVSYHQL